jgi:hypothetical protein
MTEARAKLQAAKDAVRIGAVGLQGGVYTGFTTIDVRSLEDAVVKYGVAQALLDGLATTEEGLAVRDILVDKDFEDKNGNAIGKRDWIQPWSGNWLNTDAQTETQVYQTNKDVDNTQKVLCIYGVRATNIGPGDVSTTLNVSSLIFKRSSVKTIDIWQIEVLDSVPDRVVYARTPLLYKKGDNARIDFMPKTGVSGTTDNLILLGKTIEPLGKEVTG